MRARPLPDALATGPFSTARARELGLPKMRVHRGDLVHPTHGAHSLREPVTLAERAAAYAAGMPSARAFSHVTAALLLGLPLRAGLEAQARDGDLHVMAPTRDGRVQRAGCRGHRGLEIRATTCVDGVQVVGAADTWCDLGELRRGVLGVEDLVVAGDAAVALLDAGSEVRVRSAGLTSPGVRALHQALHSRVRPRGKVMLSQALALVRPRVRSPMETRARLMFVRAGFPEPEVNGVVRDEAGEFVAEADLIWRRQRVIAEYQGQAHAEIRRRSGDEVRRRQLEALDHTVREIFAEDVHRTSRRVETLMFMARALDLDPATLLIA
jgi:hypothetical protein